MSGKLSNNKANPKFFKKLEGILTKSNTKIPRIKFKDKNYFHAKASFISYSLCITRPLWNALNSNERIAVALHETGHLNYKWRFMYLISLISLLIVLAPVTIFISQPISWIIDFIIFRFLYFYFLSLLSQNDELEADKFVYERVDAKHLLSAIEKNKKGKNSMLIKILYWLFIFPFDLYPKNRTTIIKNYIHHKT